jgi:HD-GYP domain-containing protein (c-di-GMP phosphodiesterase class II)/pSer/pThr/pTyr-binding forkhead associated (FHA) protein
MQHEVFIQSGNQKGFRIPISTEKPTVIGRASDCDLRLLDEGVSRRHCRLEPAGSGVQLIDLGSHNGTRVNGELKGSVKLRNGDLIALGNCVLRYGIIGSDLLGQNSNGLGQSPSEERAADLFARGVAAFPPLPALVSEQEEPTEIGHNADLLESEQLDTDLDALLNATLSDEDETQSLWDPPEFGAKTAIDHTPTRLFMSDDLTLHTSLRRRYTGSDGLAESESELHRAGESVRLAAVYEAARLIHGERNLDVILDRSAETILDVARADRVAILLKGDSDELEPVTTRLRPEKQRAGEAFKVSRTIVVEPLQGISVISSDAAEDDRFREGESVLIQQVRSVMCVPLQAREAVIGVLYVDSLSYAAVFKETDLALLAAIGQQVGVAIERAKLMDDLENLFVGAMLAITASIEAKDPYTRGHSERVTLYSLMLADALAVPQATRDVVELGALLHDVGKIGIPERVLCKPGALDDAEFEIMKQHPALGAKIIGNMPELDRIVDMKGVIHAVRHHHEKVDGSGYPDGLKNDEILLPARILAVADAYDALITDRPYRRGCKKEKALSILLKNKGKQFDAKIVEAFCAMMASDEPPTATAMRGRFRVTQFHRTSA